MKRNIYFHFISFPTMGQCRQKKMLLMSKLLFNKNEIPIIQNKKMDVVTLRYTLLNTFIISFQYTHKFYSFLEITPKLLFKKDLTYSSHFNVYNLKQLFSVCFFFLYIICELTNPDNSWTDEDFLRVLFSFKVR